MGLDTLGVLTDWQITCRAALPCSSTCSRALVLPSAASTLRAAAHAGKGRALRWAGKLMYGADSFIYTRSPCHF